MSSGKANSGSLLKAMQSLKANVASRRSERGLVPNRNYPELARGGGRGRGGRAGRGRVGRGALGVDFDPPPSAEGDVAPELYLEGPSGAGPSGAGTSGSGPSGAGTSGADAEMESTDELEVTEEEARPKKLRTRGESRVLRKEPATEEEKIPIIPAGKDNWKFPPGVKYRLPNSLLVSLIKRYWPGYYTPLGMVPGGAPKLASTWADYEVAPGVGFLTAAEAVITKFWCFYRLHDPDDEERAKINLYLAAERLTPQIWYNQKATSAYQFWSQRGVKCSKEDIVGLDPKPQFSMTLDEYISVAPEWTEGREAAWRLVIKTRWLRVDEEFAAVSRRNVENRGDGGTHCAGNLSFDRFKEKMVSERPKGEVITDAMVYDKMRMKRPDLSQPQPQPYAEYFGNAKEAISEYCRVVQERHPEVADPLEVETDEEALLLSSRGLGHGRLDFMNAAVKHNLSTTYTRVKSGLTADSTSLPPRHKPRRSTYDAEFEAAYSTAHQDYQHAFHEHQQATAAYMKYMHAMMMAMHRGQTVDLGPEVPMPGPAPMFPGRDAFYEMYYGSPPGTRASFAPSSGREFTPVHGGGHSPGYSADHPGTSRGTSYGGSSAASTGAQARPRIPRFTRDELGFTPPPESPR